MGYILWTLITNVKSVCIIKYPGNMGWIPRVCVNSPETIPGGFMETADNSEEAAAAQKQN